MSARLNTAAALIACALTLALVAAVPANAAPILGLQLTRTDAPITHSDERLAYKATVKNIASANPAVGTELTCDGKKWFGEPVAKLSFAYQWTRNGAPIGGATAKTYTAEAADAGTALQCLVTGTVEATNPAENESSTVTSQPPAVVEPVPAPAPPGATSPTLASSRPTTTIEGGGVIAVGKELKCTPPTGWSGSPTWSFQWLRNGKAIAAATAEKYTVVVADEHTVLQCEVLGSNAGGAALGVSIIRPGPGTEPAGVENAPSNGVLQTPVTAFSNKSVGPINVEFELPPGTQGLRVLGSGWTCAKLAPTPSQVATAKCSRSDTLEPAASYPAIEAVIQVGASAADNLKTKVTASGGGAVLPVSAEDEVTGILPAVPFGFKAFEVKVLDALANNYSQAGGHPVSAGAKLEFTDHRKAEESAEAGFRAANGFVKVVKTDTPRGFVGNAQALAAKCPSLDDVLNETCPAASVVGGITLEAAQSAPPNLPIYAIEPEYGTPAQFAFAITVIHSAYVLTPELRPEDGYAITLATAPVQKEPELFGADVTLCGIGTKFQTVPFPEFKGCKSASEVAPGTVPLITNPTRCSGPPPTTRISANTWEDPDNWASAESSTPPLEGCDKVDFEPTVSLQPTSHQADSPTGMDVEISMPTEGLEDPEGIAQANLANSTVTLPVGMSVNPSLAAGLGACTQAELGMHNGVPDNEPAQCPESAKVGTVEVRTPLLAETLKGTVYVAKQGENPFGSLLGLYLVFESKRDGITIKVAGKVSPDPVTGQLTASFKENPEAPFSKLSLHFASGNKAALINPPLCGTYAITSELSPWTALDPANPSPAEVVTSTSTYQVSTGPGGGACPSGGLDPRLKSGLANPTAASTSPFALRLSREDGTQRFSALDVTMPPGLTGYLKGIPYCSDAALASISSTEGTGAAQLASPACPAASLLGSASVGAGAGPNPFYVNTGKAYLAGPYKGAPLSIAIVTPALAGPFDLGTVTVRSGLYVDPETAQITVKSDPIPTILHGLLLDVRDIRVNIDRPHFILAPTNCDPHTVSALVKGEKGASASVSNPFQVSGCQRLAFKPKLNLRLFGGTRRGSHPRLKATLTARPGDANIAGASVALPHSEFLEQSHIGTVCTRPQFAAKQCPGASVYGHAEALTPLLDQPVSGPVYLRSSDNLLPDLVAVLRGPDSQPIEVALDGRVDSVHGGIRTSFEAVPDQPVSSFTLSMQGGSKGLLVNSRNLCKSTGRATVRFTAQNGKAVKLRPKLQNSCGGAGTRHKSHNAR